MWMRKEKRVAGAVDDVALATRPHLGTRSSKWGGGAAVSGAAARFQRIVVQKCQIWRHNAIRLLMAGDRQRDDDADEGLTYVFRIQER
jgi:hypothetical protein